MNFIKIRNEKCFAIEGSPLWIFQDIWKIAISSADVGEKYFLEHFLILCIIEIQKIPTLRTGNFLRVNLSLPWWILGRLKLCYIKDIYYLLDSFSPQENWLVQAGNKGPTVEHLKLFLSSLLKCCVVNALNSLTLILKV